MDTLRAKRAAEEAERTWRQKERMTAVRQVREVRHILMPLQSHTTLMIMHPEKGQCALTFCPLPTGRDQ